MLARSVRNPLIIGVGTGIVLVSSTASAALAVTDTPSPSADPSPTKASTTPGTPSTPPYTKSPTSDPPSSSPSTPPPAPKLALALTRTSSGDVHAGSVVKYTAHVSTDKGTLEDVRLTLGVKANGSISASCVMSSGQCKLGDVNHTGEDVNFSLTVSSKMTSGGTIRFSGEAFSGAVKVDSDKTLTVTKTKSSSSSNSSGSSSGSSGSSGSSSGSSTSTLSTGDLNPSGSDAGTPSTAPSNSAVLPPITSTQAPTTAPGPVVQNAGNSQSMRGTADEADQLTFDKLASTQAAWLAALLVAFFLLLTQVRLGKASNKDPRQKGAHRRPRRPGSAH